MPSGVGPRLTKPQKAQTVALALTEGPRSAAAAAGVTERTVRRVVAQELETNGPALTAFVQQKRAEAMEIVGQRLKRAVEKAFDHLDAVQPGDDKAARAARDMTVSAAVWVDKVAQYLGTGPRLTYGTPDDTPVTTVELEQSRVTIDRLIARRSTGEPAHTHAREGEEEG